MTKGFLKYPYLKIINHQHVFAKICYFLVFISYAFEGFAQQASNEWIEFNQPYYKIPVAADGIYRLSYADLSAAGFPVASVNPANIQLYHRGIEQAIFIPEESDGSFDTSDFIEFYGQRNDGTLDKELYVSPDAQPHSYYNLYTDTTAYFLTIASEPGKRMGLFGESIPGGKEEESYHWDEKLLVGTSDYWQGRMYSVDTYLTQFDYAEGWTGSRIGRGAFKDYTITGIQNTYTGGPQPKLELLLTGRNNRLHSVDILVGASSASLRTINNVTFSGHGNEKMAADIAWSDISAEGNLVVRIRVNDLGASDYVSYAYIKLNYPQQFNMNAAPEKIYNLPAIASGKSLINILNTPSSATVYDITDTDNLYKINYTPSGNNISFIAPNTFSERKLFVHGGNFFTPSLHKVNFRNINPAVPDYLIISHQRLMQPAGEVNDPVKAYAAYRASAEGGGFDTLVVNMQQLYDQFSYGEITPLAIRNFAEFMINGGNPGYLFLIGRGLTVFRKPHRQINPAYRDLVPSAGEPGSDIAFTAGLKPDSPYAPAIPTGRLAARYPEEVLAYLNKVKEMANVPFDALWRKDFLHLSGGNTTSELNLFRRYVEDFEQVAEGHYMGAHVTTTSKKTNNTVELINIAEEVNEGLSFITFFGHSSLGSTDIEVGYVSDDVLGYKNKGKYPMFLVNGCDAGGIFYEGISFGEDWMLTPDRGAIGFIAHTATGLSPNLKNYSDIFYATAFGDSSFINQSIGDIQKEVIKRYIDRLSSSPSNISQVQQMLLQGDPYIKPFAADQPDYETNDDHLFLEAFNDQTINALADSFKIGIITRNFGITDPDSISVGVSRTFSNGEVINYDAVLYPPVLYQDTLYFTIHNANQENFGENRFEVFLDNTDSIAEFNEGNNSAVLNYYINLGGTTNLMPADFSIVSNNKVEFIVQSNNIFPISRSFLIELDTVNTFNSPARQQQNLTATKLASWEVNLSDYASPEDSVVYYWRSKFAQPKTGEDTSWTISSFVYIKESPEGWAQMHYPQFNNNNFQGLISNDDLKKRQFEETEISVSVKTYGNAHPEKNWEDIELFINGVPQISLTWYKVCYPDGIYAMAFDKTTLMPYLIYPKTSLYDKTACGREPFAINSFNNNNINNNLILEEYIDKVGEGDHVLFFSAGNVSYQSWPETTRQKLLSIGASEDFIASLNDGNPFIVLGRKGTEPGTATEVAGDATLGIPVNEQEIDLSANITGKFNRGVITSPRIGPASSWETIHMQFVLSDPPENDKVSYDVIGIDSNDNKTVLYSEVKSKVLDISTIDPDRFPYLQLQVTVEDEVDLSAAQLDKWLVIYKGVPEGVLFLKDSEPEKYKNVTKQEGEEFNTDFVFRNISTRDFSDSLTVRYSLFNSTNRTTENFTFRTKPLPAKDTVSFSIAVSTFNRIGKNDLKVNVNPRVLPEQNYNNNIIDLKNYFNVTQDNSNPLIDVAFDGQYIMNGDIVSPDPLISVIMKDRNTLLYKKDTTGMEVLLKRPCETCTYEKINFSSPNVNWIPADENSDFKVEFMPETLADGIHTLQVQATDASGNKAGTKPYSINFEVINESSITHFYPYPNPFSTSTRFIFTLTGSEIPDEIKIQILTVTGKIVREITQNELGPVNIGHNISDYAWNGKDEFGDQLANGVYLYRVIVRNNGQHVENRKTSADKAFSKEYGKIYLLR